MREMWLGSTPFSPLKALGTIVFVLRFLDETTFLQPKKNQPSFFLVSPFIFQPCLDFMSYAPS